MIPRPEARCELDYNAECKMTEDGFLELVRITNKIPINMTGVTDMSYGCYQFKHPIDVSVFDTTKVLDMSYMFSESKPTEWASIPSLKIDSAVNLSHMFHKANITALDLSTWIQDKPYMDGNWDYMFADCPNLTTVNISQWGFGKGSTAHMFSGCPNLTSIMFKQAPSNPYSKVNLDTMFLGCPNLDRESIHGFLLGLEDEIAEHPMVLPQTVYNKLTPDDFTLAISKGIGIRVG